MRRSRVYDLINKSSTVDLRVLARKMAEHIEQFGPYGLKQFEPAPSFTEIQYRSAPHVNDLVEELKVLKHLVANWYMPGHVISAAMSSSRTTTQIANLLVNTYGPVTYIHEARNIEKMVRLILSIAGMVNLPMSAIQDDGTKSSQRRWRLVKGVTVDDIMLNAEFEARMGTV